MANKEKNFISAVIYVHNAEDRIAEFLDVMIADLEEHFEHSEIICVNDCSNDDSVQMIKKVAQKAGNVSITILSMSYFHGLEAAMNAGVDLSIGDFVFEFDNTFLDFERDMIMEVYRRALQGYDIVSASPDRKERFTSGLFYRVFGYFTEFSSKMCTESFRILSRRVINRIHSMNKTVLYRKAVYENCGLKMDRIKYKVRDASHGKTDPREKKYRAGLAADSLILFTEVGYRFSKGMTVFMMFMSIFMTVYSIVVYLSIHPVAGWTTTILFLSVAFFGLFGVLTIIIKYLQLLVDLVFKRKHYSFESIEKIT